MPDHRTTLQPAHLTHGAPPAPRHGVAAGEDRQLFHFARLAPQQACAQVGSSLEGLTQRQAHLRLRRHGANLVARERSPSVLRELWGRAANPLNALLVALALVSYALGDLRAALVVLVMVVLAIGTSFAQEHRSIQAAARLRAMVRNTASVRRRGGEGFAEVPVETLVPGDVVSLSAGDMIPADLRLLSATDLFINQSALTGESMPAEKFAAACSLDSGNALELPNLCFMGANVVSGAALGVVLRTGAHTYFGELADRLVQTRAPTAFERGVARFTWLMIRVMAVMVPLVLLINGFTKHDWLQALLFAVAVAVGLTPEMLPMIVTVNLAKGALAMSREKVIVKRLGAIQNFGAMDVLCTDKTGTLTQDTVILKRHLDLRGNESERVLHYAWLNSHFQSGLRNLLDAAVLQHVELHERYGREKGFAKVDEIPFDFVRRRMSVIVSTPEGRHVLVCKGAVEETVATCTRFEADGTTSPLDASHLDAARKDTEALNADGFRVVAVAFKELPGDETAYCVADERELTLLGYIAFLDPPKDSAREALAALATRGVVVKILTGDNDIVTRRVCHEVGLDAGEVVLGSHIDAMGDTDLAQLADRSTVFARLTPAQKERIVRLLRSRGHVVGYLGDGINDSPALRAADVSVSVDTAVDIAKEAADIILLEKSLLILHEGVLEGRKVFCNISKYIRMGASSNFGNMLSVLGASLFLPFLPMGPIQVLVNNLLYDFSQTAIPTDHVDEDELLRPRRWDIQGVFRFMVRLGPVSSLFDYLTFAFMLYVLHAGAQPALFQSGWFVESLLSQTLIVHVIRTARVPFFESRASAALTSTTAIICLVGMALPYTAVGHFLGFEPLPLRYWLALALMLPAYALLAHLAKRRFVARFGM